MFSSDLSLNLALLSLSIAIFSPLLAYWRIRIEHIKLQKKDSSKRQKMISDALRLYAGIFGRMHTMLQAIIEKRHAASMDQNEHQLLLKLERKLRKKLKEVNALYKKTAALRSDGDWDEEWLRAEIDALMISCQNTLIYDDLEKEVAILSKVGISTFHTDGLNNKLPDIYSTLDSLGLKSLN